MKVAAVNWQLRPQASLDGFFDHARELLIRSEGADLVVFPEQPCLELLGGDSDPPIEAMGQDLAERFWASWGTFGDLAKEFSCVWVAGSYFVEREGHIFNCAVVGMPDGRVSIDVPKVVMTQFEHAEWGLRGGAGLRTLPDETIGVTICYDCEFPESGRQLAESGVLVQCVPAFTETVHGFTRVRGSCLARAIENQIIVVHASLTGSLGKEPVPDAVGSSAILAPPVDPFPSDGILGETDHNEEGVVVVDVDLSTLLRSRESGDVRNWHDRARGDWSLRPATFLE